jgi:hypothetical protein
LFNAYSKPLLHRIMSERRFTGSFMLPDPAGASEFMRNGTLDHRDSLKGTWRDGARLTD